MNHYDYLGAGFRVFGIHGATDGKCNCEREDCEALYKHPVISNWQNVPHWSDEQIEVFESMGHFETGFGVLVSGFLVVDVDARNGGIASLEKLQQEIPEIEKSGFVVETGSGGGSRHFYFSVPEGLALSQHHKDYPGIDFKTSGFVIGAGSLHASGAIYEAITGHPDDVAPAPQSLLDLLKKPDTYRASTANGAVDITGQSIADMLDHISPDCGYEEWVRVGMAIHHVLLGEGFDLWDSWSSNGTKYSGPDALQRHWHSFGKSATPVSIGTLLHYAREGGYVEPIEFAYEAPPEDEALDTTGVDLLRPPGFVGELTEWINAQCLYPREHLAVAAALVAVGSLAGMRFYDELDDMTPNLLAFCVAGSGTGKEAVNQAYLKIMRAAGVQSAVHGAFKSEQELLRNFIRHQAAFYSMDELGITLRKLENASKRGGASYLEGIIGLVMSVYSKANGYLPISGDLKDEIKQDLMKELGRIRKRMDDMPQDTSEDGKKAALQREEERLEQALGTIDNGLDSPFLTLLGYTTPVTFNELMGYEQATNGFMSRAMIFNDLETNPRRKAGFRKTPMSDKLTHQIAALYAPGVFDMKGGAQRVEHKGEKTPIPTDAGGVAALEQVYEAFHALADEHKGATGLEAIPRRGYEIAAKVSLVLAIPDGVRTAEHIRWGYALAMRDCLQKIQLAHSNAEEEAVSGLAARVLSIISHDHGETLAVIANRLRGTPKEQVAALLAQMVDKGLVVKKEEAWGKGKKVVARYYGTR